MDILATLSEFGVVPVIAIDDAKDALPLANALIEGGLPVAEITFRTPAAQDAIAAMISAHPDMHVGAGTVLTQDQIEACHAAGAKFALSPGLDLEILDAAKEKDLPFVPGIMTPTDLQAALKADCTLVKFFPAMAAGGPNMLKNIAAPYAHTGIGFNPTGGVNLDNLGDWLAIPQVRAVGGTWIASKKDIAEGNWAQITQNARAAVAKVKDLRAETA